MTWGELRAMTQGTGADDDAEIRFTVTGVVGTQHVELWGQYHGEYAFEVDIDRTGELYEVTAGDGVEVRLEV